MKKRSLLVPMLASAALLLASCDIMPPDFRNYSYPEESSSSKSSSKSSSSSSSSESTTSESTSTSTSESTSTSTSESTESTQSTESTVSSESSEEEGVTATKNGQAATLTEITAGEGNKAAYQITLAVGDVISLKDGETALHFYHWEGGDDGHAVDDGATFTAKVAGDHKIYYGNDGKLWMAEPEPEPSSTTVEIEFTFTDSWAKNGGAVFYVASYEANWTSMTWHLVDADDKTTIPDSTVTFIVVRMDPSKVTEGPNWDAKWNQSANMNYTAGTTNYSISFS